MSRRLAPSPPGAREVGIRIGNSKSSWEPRALSQLALFSSWPNFLPGEGNPLTCRIVPVLPGLAQLRGPGGSVRFRGLSFFPRSPPIRIRSRSEITSGPAVSRDEIVHQLNIGRRSASADWRAGRGISRPDAGIAEVAIFRSRVRPRTGGKVSPGAQKPPVTNRPSQWTQQRIDSNPKSSWKALDLSSNPCCNWYNLTREN